MAKTNVAEGMLGQATDVTEVVLLMMFGGEMYPFRSISASLAKIVAARCHGRATMVVETFLNSVVSQPHA